MVNLAIAVDMRVDENMNMPGWWQTFLLRVHFAVCRQAVLDRGGQKATRSEAGSSGIGGRDQVPQLQDSERL